MKMERRAQILRDCRIVAARLFGMSAADVGRAENVSALTVKKIFGRHLTQPDLLPGLYVGTYPAGTPYTASPEQIEAAIAKDRQRKIEVYREQHAAEMERRKSALAKTGTRRERNRARHLAEMEAREEARRAAKAAAEPPTD